MYLTAVGVAWAEVEPAWGEGRFGKRKIRWHWLTLGGRARVVSGLLYFEFESNGLHKKVTRHYTHILLVSLTSCKSVLITAKKQFDRHEEEHKDGKVIPRILRNTIGAQTPDLARCHLFGAIHRV